MFKKVCSLVLAVMMLLTMVSSMTVLAAEDPVIGVFSAADVAQAERGDAVTVTFFVVSVAPWAAIEFEGTYDTDLTPVAVPAEDGVRIEDGEIEVAVALSDNTEELITELFSVEFTVNADAALNTTAAIEIETVAAADENGVWLAYDTELDLTEIRIICAHANGSVVANADGVSHTVTCGDCDAAVEECYFEYVDTMFDVAHGEMVYDIYACTMCTNVMTEDLYELPHDSEGGARSRGNYNAEKTHNIVCSEDGAVVGTEKCTFSDTTGCLIVCDQCRAVYVNENLLTAAHKNTNEHYYAPTVGALGMITVNCGDCNTVISSTTEAGVGDWAFTDVSSDKWYYHAVTFNNAYGLFNGTSDTTFSPAKTITRGQAAAVLSRMLLAEINKAAGQNVTEDTLKNMTADAFNSYIDGLVSRFQVEKKAIPAFTDVKTDAYYFGHIRLMAALGIVNGKSATEFKPGDTITRQELAALMSRMVKVLEKVNGETYNSFGTPVAAYSDAASISAWAKSDVEFVRTTGLMQGKNGNAFVPKGTANRAEVATLLMRLKITVGDITTHNM